MALHSLQVPVPKGCTQRAAPKVVLREILPVMKKSWKVILFPFILISLYILRISNISFVINNIKDVV